MIERQRRGKPRPGDPPLTTRSARCRPTLYARFHREQLVEVWHHHAERRPGDGGDPGCHGGCVGRRDVLPLSYLDKGADHAITPLRPDLTVRA